MIHPSLQFGAAVMLAFSAFTPGASAAAPVSNPFDIVVESEVVSACGFPVHVSANISGTEKLFFDKGGSLTRVLVHQVEQDVITANGITLVSEPYTYNIEVQFDAQGNVKDVIAKGIIAKIRLPQGPLFLSAGLSFFSNHPGESFIFVADIGRSGDLNALCAALTP